MRHRPKAAGAFILLVLIAGLSCIFNNDDSPAQAGYSSPRALAEAYLAVGRYQEVIDLSSATLRATGGLEELYYYRGLALQATGQPDAANDNFRAALDYNPNFAAAAVTSVWIPERTHRSCAVL